MVVLSCPDGWVGYNDKCYHFSNDSHSYMGALVGLLIHVVMVSDFSPISAEKL